MYVKKSQLRSNNFQDPKLMTQHEVRPAQMSRCTLHRSLTGKPAPEILRVFGLQPVWPLAPGT